MPDQTLERFAREAERLVTPPTLAELTERGIRRRQRHAVATTSAVVVAALVGWWTLGGLPRGPVATPVDRPGRVIVTDPDQLPYARSQTKDVRLSVTPLRSGRAYHARPFGPEDPVSVGFASPFDGWDWTQSGEVRPGSTGPSGSDPVPVRLVVMAPTTVRSRPCEAAAFQYWDSLATTDVAAAAQLTSLPELSIPVGSEQVTAFGRPAVHLQLRVTRSTCPQLHRIPLLLNDHDRLELAPPATVDLWFMETGSGPLLVMTEVRDDASRTQRRELARVLASVQVTEQH